MGAMGLGPPYPLRVRPSRNGPKGPHEWLSSISRFAKTAFGLVCGVASYFVLTQGVIGD